MSEADYYPAVAYNDPRAPWNEPLPKEESFNVKYDLYVPSDEEDEYNVETHTATLTIEIYDDLDEYDKYQLEEMLTDELCEELDLPPGEFEILKFEHI